MVRSASENYSQLEAAGILLYIAYRASSSIAGAFNFVKTQNGVEQLNYFTRSIDWVEQGPHMVVINLENMNVLASDWTTDVNDAIALCNNID